MIKPELVEEDRGVPGDQRTVELVAIVANSIFKFIQVPSNYPSKHTIARWCPFLIYRLGSTEMASSPGRKKMANFLVLTERSASDRQKRVSLTQEVVRILRNTKTTLLDDIKNGFLVRVQPEDEGVRLLGEVPSGGGHQWGGRVQEAAGQGRGRCLPFVPTQGVQSQGEEQEEAHRQEVVVQALYHSPLLPPLPRQLKNEYR